MERSGAKVKATVCRSNPWRDTSCGREGCDICEGGDEKQVRKCKDESITYEIECVKCKAEGKVIKYIGESSHSAWERKGEHDQGLSNEEVNNPLWKHSMNEHGGEKLKFSMKVTGKHRTAMRRKIAEWIKIDIEAKKRETMNSKNDWNAEAMPRVTIEGEKKKNSKEGGKRNRGENGEEEPRQKRKEWEKKEEKDNTKGKTTGAKIRIAKKKEKEGTE